MTTFKHRESDWAGKGGELPGIGTLISGLDRAVAVPDVHRVAEEVKTVLEKFSHEGAQALPEQFGRSSGDAYARRLLHRHPLYTVVVMTWGPHQRTELHDHAGIWCVECVVRGELDVTQFDVIEQQGDRFRFEARKQVRAIVGDAGCLIPPFEYHTLSNPTDDMTAMTVHVYGGEMEMCNCYRPADSGWWQQVPKHLAYTD